VYSPLIVDRNLWAVQKSLSRTLTRYSPSESITRTAELSGAHNFTAEDLEFISNEQILSQLDFRYFAQRYYNIDIDAAMGGGMGSMDFWEPQLLLLDKLSSAEERCQEQLSRGEPVDGILVVCNKARQIGFTAIWRALTAHRIFLHDHMRAMAASLNEELALELYDRDKLAYNNLPWFLKPESIYDVKGHQLHFNNESRLLYMESAQRGGFGISRQFEVGHLTEVSQWEYSSCNRIQLDLLPAIPQSHKVLFGMEAVPCGRGTFWHEFTEDVRRGKHPRWVYVYIPWYAEPRKYRRQPPVNWVPSEVAADHARKVHETSHLYTKWPHYFLPPDNLYWWETTREEFRIAGNLNYFLTNYSATPEESFQHSGRSAFPIEYLEWARNHSSWDESVAYDIELERRVSM
jgi:hypothetical protein